jgi:F-type H+-transporting ATPase subunit delta
VQSSPVARRYARALFSIAAETGAQAAVRGELEAIAAALAGSEPLRDALLRPLHPVAERRAVLQRIAQRLGIGASVQNFLEFLVDQRRIVEFDGIHAEFVRMCDEAAGRMQAELISACPLQANQVERVRAALAARTGREIDLDVRVEPELIGGGVAVVGGLVFDGSLRTQLSQLRDTLTRGQ